MFSTRNFIRPIGLPIGAVAATGIGTTVEGLTGAAIGISLLALSLLLTRRAIWRIAVYPERLQFDLGPFGLLSSRTYSKEDVRAIVRWRSMRIVTTADGVTRGTLDYDLPVRASELEHALRELGFNLEQP